MKETRYGYCEDKLIYVRHEDLFLEDNRHSIHPSAALVFLFLLLHLCIIIVSTIIIHEWILILFKTGSSTLLALSVYSLFSGNLFHTQFQLSSVHWWHLQLHLYLDVMKHLKLSSAQDVFHALLSFSDSSTTVQEAQSFSSVVGLHKWYHCSPGAGVRNWGVILEFSFYLNHNSFCSCTRSIFLTQ